MIHLAFFNKKIYIFENNIIIFSFMKYICIFFQKCRLVLEEFRIKYCIPHAALAVDVV